MGLFDIFKKKKEEPVVSKQEEAVSKPEEVASKLEEVEAVGWQAIEQEFLRVYPGQENPKHYGTIIKWVLGGKDPLDGISIYDGGSYWHFVSFGQTEIYEKETDTPDVSGYGYELTFKLKKDEYEDEEAELRNICGIPGIDARQKSNLTGFITVKDPTVETIDTPNGRVEFLELVGMTDAELKTLSTVGSVMEIYDKLGSDVTDYNRESIV